MIKKLLTYSVVITTVVWSVGLLATPLAVGAAVSGDLIKLSCASGAGVNDPCRAVYYLGSDGKRYVFPNEKTYSTWYSDFSGVGEVSSTEMSSYSIGGNATYRPGSKLVKITTDPKVYAVAGNGTLMWVTTGDLAEGIYGADWTSMVEDVPDAFFVNYTVGGDIDEVSDYDKTAQMDASPNINDDKNLVSGGGDGGTVSTGTGLTVALASDTPASGIVVANSINNKFTKIDLTASADGDIIIDQIIVKRAGTVASDGPFSSLAIIDVATNKRIGNTKTINSQHKAVFNKDFTVAAGTTKSIYLVGNMGTTSIYGGEIPSLSLESIILTGSAATIGTLPVAGNYQTINGTITIGTLTLANGSNNPDAATQKIGTNNYIVSGFKLTASSAEDFKVTQVNFNDGGTSADGDVGNLDLYVDDVLVATLAEPNDGDVFFDLSGSPINIEKGKTVQFDLQIDILGGSDRTIRFDVKDESDVVAMGQVYGAEVKVAAGAGATSDADPFWTAPIVTVDKGALRIGPATFTSANIPEDVTQVALGKFEFEAKGEGVEITALPIHFLVNTSTGSLITDSTVDITNVTVYDENGVIVAGPDDPGEDYTVAGNNPNRMLGVTSTDTISVPAGVHIYTIKADLDSDFGSDDTIIVHIKPDQITAKGETTGLAVTPTPGTTEATSATMTVKTAALSLSTSPTPVAQNVVAGTRGYIFAKIILGAESSGEDVKVTKVSVRVECDANCMPSEVSNFSLFDGDTELAVSNDPDSVTSGKVTNDDEATSTFNLSTPLVITKGTSKTLTVRGDISNSATDGTMTIGMSDTTSGGHVTAKGNDTALDATITLNASDGQAMTFKELGELTISRDSSSPKTGLLPASSSGLTLGVFNAFSKYEDINIEKIYMTAVAGNSGGLDQISKLYIYEGSTLLAAVTPTSTDGADKTLLIDTTNNPIVITKDVSTKLTIKVDTSATNYELGSIGASGQGLWLKINATGDVTAKGAQSGKTITTLDITNASTTDQYLFKSIPTLATNDLLSSGKVAGGTLSGGVESSKALYAFSVTADSAGDIALHHVSFRVATSVATITDMKITDGTENVAFRQTANYTVSSSSDQDKSDDLSVEVDFFWFVDNQTAPSASSSSNVVPYTIAAGTTKTFTLKGNVECSQTGGSNCNGSNGSGSINIQLLGDTVFPSTVPDSLPGLMTLPESISGFNVNFAWSDLWRTHILGTSSTTASNTEQWSNGAFVALTNGGKMVATSTAVTFTR